MCLYSYGTISLCLCSSNCHGSKYFYTFFFFPLAEYFHQKFTAGSKAKFQPHWRSILISWNQIGLLSMFVGAILNIYEVPRPDIFDPIFNASVHLGAWFGILPVGYLLNFKAARLYRYLALTIVPVRFLIIPVLSFITASLFTDNTLLIFRHHFNWYVSYWYQFCCSYSTI